MALVFTVIIFNITANHRQKQGHQKLSVWQTKPTNRKKMFSQYTYNKGLISKVPDSKISGNLSGYFFKGMCQWVTSRSINTGSTSLVREMHIQTTYLLERLEHPVYRKKKTSIYPKTSDYKNDSLFFSLSHTQTCIEILFSL